jgi:hypothetical protein
MVLLPIAVDGLTLVDDNPVNTTNTTITSIPSTKVKAENKGIIKKELEFTILAGSGIVGSCVLVADLPLQTIDPTATKVKAEGELVMREQDSKVINATGQTVPPPPPPAPCPLVFQMRISDAGQTKVKGQ